MMKDTVNLASNYSATLTQILTFQQKQCLHSLNPRCSHLPTISQGNHLLKLNTELCWNLSLRFWLESTEGYWEKSKQLMAWKYKWLYPHRESLRGFWCTISEETSSQGWGPDCDWAKFQICRMGGCYWTWNQGQSKYFHCEHFTGERGDDYGLRVTCYF